MIRSKIFTFFTVALIGGFVLTTSSDALAVSFNQNAEKTVADWASKYGISSEGGKSVETAQSEFEKNLKNIKSEYESAYIELSMMCAEKWLSATFEEGVDGAKNCLSNLKNSLTSFKGLSNLPDDAVDCFKDFAKFAGDTIKQAGLSAAQGLLMSAKKAVMPQCHYMFESEITQVIAVCKTLGVHEDPEVKTKIEDIESKKLAQNTQIAVDKFCAVKDKTGKIFEHCVEITDSNGNKTQSCMEYIIDFKGNTIESITGVTRGCEPLPFKMYQAHSCLFCPLFTIIFNTVQSASTSAYTTLGDSLAVLVAIGFSIWLALMVLKQVSAMTQQDGREFLTKLFANSFKIVIAFLLLKNSGIVYGWIIGPILKAGFELGSGFVTEGESMLKNCEMKNYSAGNGVLPDYIGVNLMCFIEGIQYKLGEISAIGESLMCISRNAGAADIEPLSLRKVWPDFSMMFQGALIFAISFILAIAFSFYLLDATIQLGLFGVLLPFFILCWPFKITNGYFKKGVEIFMNSWFVFVFMGIVVSIVIELIGQALTGGKADSHAVERAINGNDVKALKDLLGIGFSGFLVLLACCVFSLKLMMKVEEIAGNFSGGLSLGIGSKFGSLAAQGAEKVAMAGVTRAGKIAKGVTKGVANAKLWEGKDGKFYSLADGFRSVQNKVSQKAAHGFTSTVRGAGRGVANVWDTITGRRNPSR